MLREIDNNLWIAEQHFQYYGLSVGTRMTVIALKNNNLVIISPINLEEKIQKQLAEIGEVKYIIAPNLYHYFFANDCKKLYPQAQFLAAPGLKQKKPELTIDRDLQDGDIIGNELICLLFEGFKILDFKGISLVNECVFFHAQTKTLIITDIAYHFDRNFPFVNSLITKILGVNEKLSPSFLEKFASKDKQKIKQSVLKILEWDFQRVIMAHGSIVEKNAKQKFREGYEWFLDTLFTSIK